MFVHDINGNDEIKVHSLKSPFNLIDIDGENDGDVLADDTDADGDHSCYQIAVTGGSNSAFQVEVLIIQAEHQLQDLWYFKNWCRWNIRLCCDQLQQMH